MIILKNINLVLFTLLIIALLSPMLSQAQDEFRAITLDASDVNCKNCHENSPHVIHDGKPVDCTDCHGEQLSVKIPQCSKCHSGPIHKVHERKVKENGCAFCHNNIEGKHQTFLADSVCEHCHKNLFEIHGGDASCVKCHQSAPNIVKPYMSPEMTLVCENCHEADNIAYVHGDENNITSCYNCHRARAPDRSDAQIPHIIHIPKVDCMRCHWDANTDSIVLPQCSRCHNIQKIHAYEKIGKELKGDVVCHVCHPDLTIKQKMGLTTETSSVVVEEDISDSIKETTSPVVETAPPIEIEEYDAESEDENAAKTPGFGALTGILAVSLVFALRRFR